MEPMNLDATTDRRGQSPDNLDSYLYLDWEALNQLPIEERFRVLGELAQRAGAWLRDQRGELIDELRSQLNGGDVAVADALGLSKQAVGEMGDGPITRDGIKPKLLRRTADIIADRLPADTPVYSKAIHTAQGILARKRTPSYQDLWGAAVRIRQAGRGMTQPILRAMPYAEARTYARGAAHAVEVADRTQWRPGV